ncbi:MAG TPA: hypothetical protein VK668_04545 [Mucilaginibacter sp.]|nr:hypothetical protein [Mucilaginibacter sp.]
MPIQKFTNAITPYYIHVFNKLRNREESRDIVHDLFSSLWQKKEELEIQATLSAYPAGNRGTTT